MKEFLCWIRFGHKWYAWKTGWGVAIVPGVATRRFGVMGEPRELTADEIRSVLGAHPSRKVLENLVQRYRWLENELKDLEASFDFRWKADMRAIERWKKENPEDRSHKWPDHVNLVLFLMSELEKKECQTQEPQ